MEDRKRVITRYLSFMEDLLYTISKVKLLEDILMPQPIVPVEIPQSRRFDSKREMIFCLKFVIISKKKIGLRWVYQSHVRKSLIGISR